MEEKEIKFFRNALLELNLFGPHYIWKKKFTAQKHYLNLLIN